MTDLCENLNNLKSRYRKAFAQSVAEIRYLISSGFSREQIEKYYKKKFGTVFRERKLYTCEGCGACCKFAVSEFSFEELKIKAQSGDNFASQFVSTFIPYKTKDEARKVYSDYVDFLEKSTDGTYYFYHCPKVTEDNKCPDYENRPQICRDFPDNPIAFLPKTCSFIPWKLKSESVWLKMKAVAEILNWIYK